MLFDKIIRGCALFIFMIGSAFSASALEAPNKDLSHSHKGYFKPGAAVALTYDYDGQTEIGELENITLKLEHHYNSGYISARLLETADLNIMSHQILENEKLQTGSDLQLPIQISGHKSGEYFIGLEIIYESLAGKRSLRVLSLPVRIGRIDKSKTGQASPQSPESIAAKGLVILSAQEVIK